MYDKVHLVVARRRRKAEPTVTSLVRVGRREGAILVDLATHAHRLPRTAPICVDLTPQPSAKALGALGKNESGDYNEG